MVAPEDTLVDEIVLVHGKQQMVFRNLIFDTEVVEQRLRAGMASHHEQQASELGDEQQHHELWPAYNLLVTISKRALEVAEM
jgi:hypothetical protein